MPSSSVFFSFKSVVERRLSLQNVGSVWLSASISKMRLRRSGVSKRPPDRFEGVFQLTELIALQFAHCGSVVPRDGAHVLLCSRSAEVFNGWGRSLQIVQLLVKSAAVLKTSIKKLLLLNPVRAVPRCHEGEYFEREP
jgi:hypothetical protein